MESYERAYPTIVRLQMVADVERAFGKADAPPPDPSRGSVLFDQESADGVSILVWFGFLISCDPAKTTAMSRVAQSISRICKFKVSLTIHHRPLIATPPKGKPWAELLAKDKRGPGFSPHMGPFSETPLGPLYPPIGGGVHREHFSSREGWRLGLGWTPPPPSLSKSLAGAAAAGVERAGAPHGEHAPHSRAPPLPPPRRLRRGGLQSPSGGQTAVSRCGGIPPIGIQRHASNPGIYIPFPLHSKYTARQIIQFPVRFIPMVKKFKFCTRETF